MSEGLVQVLKAPLLSVGLFRSGGSLGVVSLTSNDVAYLKLALSGSGLMRFSWSMSSIARMSFSAIGVRVDALFLVHVFNRSHVVLR
jgi:hypothetical protein